MEYNNASDIVIGDIIIVVLEALTGGIKNESRVFVLVNILIYFVNNNNKHYKNAYDLCVRGILAPGP